MRAARLRPRKGRWFAAPAALLVFVVATASEAGPAPAAGIADGPTFAAVPWSELSLSAHKFFLGASTTLRAERRPVAGLAALLRVPPEGVGVALPDHDVVVLTSDTDLPFGRDETVTLWLDPATGAAIQAEKLTRGHDPYRKVFRYTDLGVYTWRSAPANAHEAASGPRTWTRHGGSWERSPVPLPPNLPLTDSYALLYLASAARLDRPGVRCSLAILSEGRLVELTFTADGLVQERASFAETWPGGQRHRAGQVLARKVQVSARPAGAAPGGSQVDLGFLGMRGDLTILVEDGTGIPIELSGHAEHIGALTVRLERATLRNPPPAADAAKPNRGTAEAP
jgi:hypothetical protein